MDLATANSLDRSPAAKTTEVKIRKQNLNRRKATHRFYGKPDFTGQLKTRPDVPEEHGFTMQSFVHTIMLYRIKKFPCF